MSWVGGYNSFSFFHVESFESVEVVVFHLFAFPHTRVKYTTYIVLVWVTLRG